MARPQPPIPAAITSRPSVATSATGASTVICRVNVEAERHPLELLDQILRGGTAVPGPAFPPANETTLAQAMVAFRE